MTTSSTEDDTVPRLLEEYGRLSQAALVSYTRAREPLRHLYRLVADYPERGGRMLRSSICLATAAAHGCEPRSALAPATAIELLHNAFLIHDDIEDGSQTRRGSPTLHVAHGTPLAINTGDALCLLAMQALSDCRDEIDLSVRESLADDLRRAAVEAVEGQALELGWRHDNAVHLTEADYLHMVLKKTCWYTMIFPIRAGAQIALGEPLAHDTFVAFGFLLGAAFQIQDDLLNLVGDEQRYGKERNGDLLEGKRTLMIIHLLQRLSGKDRDRLVTLLGDGVRDTESVGWILEKMGEHGSIEYARLMAHALAGAASRECERAFGALPDSQARHFLACLPRWVISRS